MSVVDVDSRPEILAVFRIQLVVVKLPLVLATVRMIQRYPAHHRRGNSVKNIAMSGLQSHGDHAQQSADQARKHEISIA